MTSPTRSGPGRPLSDDAVVARPMHSLSDCFEGYDETDPTAIIYDARHIKRATAIRHHAHEYGTGKFADVKSATRHARWLDRQEQWELGGGYDRWYDDPDEHVACPTCGAAVQEPCEGEADLPEGIHPARREAVPQIVPEGWEADEHDPAWQFCKRGDDGAIKVYRCEVE